MKCRRTFICVVERKQSFSIDAQAYKRIEVRVIARSNLEAGAIFVREKAQNGDRLIDIKDTGEREYTPNMPRPVPLMANRIMAAFARSAEA